MHWSTLEHCNCCYCCFMLLHEFDNVLGVREPSVKTSSLYLISYSSLSLPHKSGNLVQLETIKLLLRWSTPWRRFVVMKR